MNILNFAQTVFFAYWLDALIVVSFIAIVYAIGRYFSPILATDIVKHLVVQAEKELGSKTGKLKLEWVWTKLPNIIKLFLSYDDFLLLVQLSLGQLEDYLEEHKANLKGIDNE